MAFRFPPFRFEEFVVRNHCTVPADRDRPHGLKVREDGVSDWWIYEVTCKVDKKARVRTGIEKFRLRAAACKENLCNDHRSDALRKRKVRFEPMLIYRSLDIFREQPIVEKAQLGREVGFRPLRVAWPIACTCKCVHRCSDLHALEELK